MGLRNPAMLMLRVLCAVSWAVAAHAFVFDIHAANASLGVAQAAYCEDLGTWSCGAVCDGLPALTNVTVVLDQPTRGKAYVGYNQASDQIVIAFRGTLETSFSNWWSDLSSIRLISSPLCPSAGCMIGDGFAHAYGSLQKDVFIALRRLLGAQPHATVMVTGHSLGAALAHLCSLDCYNNGIAVSAINFGSPRAGNKEFAEYYNTSVSGAWRVTHYRDPIVHLPPQWGFWHTATEVFFSQEHGPTHTVCDGSGEDHACSMGLTPVPSARDHLDYLDRNLGSGIAGCPP